MARSKDKNIWSFGESCLVVSESLQPHGLYRPEYWSGQPFPSPGDLTNPGIEPRSPALQVDSLPTEPQGKPKNTGMGSLSLLQGIFPTQELNQGLLHCRRILYQLSGKLRQPSKPWEIICCCFKKSNLGCFVMQQEITGHFST